ncbi:MAG: hypothetical protein ACK4PK_04690 [Alphaproteobacteria bacterium]
MDTKKRLSVQLNKIVTVEKDPVLSGNPASNPDVNEAAEPDTGAMTMEEAQKRAREMIEEAKRNPYRCSF